MEHANVRMGDVEERRIEQFVHGNFRLALGQEWVEAVVEAAAKRVGYAQFGSVA